MDILRPANPKGEILQTNGYLGLLALGIVDSDDAVDWFLGQT